MSTGDALDALTRAEGARVLATLIRVTGSIDIAEDATQDAIVRALETWPRDGVPENPRAWLLLTAKRRATVDLAFARVPVEHLFEVVVGGDETTEHKPHPAPLLLALDRLGADPADAAYVGDSPFDMQAAKAAGVYAIGVSWGRIHGPEKLTDADVVVHEADELLDLL